MDIDLQKIKKVFFVGIGGIGISAIARMMLLQGKLVAGSDIGKSSITEELRKLGAQIVLGQGIELVPKDVNLIVYSIAVPKYDPEFFKKLQALRASGVTLQSYPEMLGQVTRAKYTIAVSGTHGKTTTTAMIGKILTDTGHHPSVIVGSLLKESKSNLIMGKSNFFVVEACEYERSFLNIKPRMLVVTNIEEDHLDYYKNLGDIQRAFKELMLQTEDLIIYNGQDANTSTLIVGKNFKCGVLDYSKFLDKVPRLSVPGAHNRMNAAAALAVAYVLNITDGDAEKSLAVFSGTWRRLEKKGTTEAGTIVYDDYAHHPTEIKASLEALRELYPKNEKRLTVLFQPHLYSRTKALFDDFVKSFKDADKVLLLPIYFAREVPDPSVSSEKLAQAIRLEGEDVQAFSDFESAEKTVLALNLGSKDVFVTMGAGEAYKVADTVFKLS